MTTPIELAQAIIEKNPNLWEYYKSQVNIAPWCIPGEKEKVGLLAFVGGKEGDSEEILMGKASSKWIAYPFSSGHKYVPKSGGGRDDGDPMKFLS